MADPHFSPEEVRRFLAFLPPQQQVALGHVLECEVCQQRLLAGLGPPPAVPAGRLLSRHDYAAMWSGVFAHLDEFIRQADADRQAAETALVELLPLAAEERRERVEHEPRLRSAAIANLLLERSFAAARDDPAEGESLAVLAIFILGRLGPDQAPAQLVEELKARAWALVAHACWIAADWKATCGALERAEQALAAAGYSTKRLGFRRTMAAFRLTEMRIEDAFNLLTNAVELLVGSLLPPTETPEPGDGGEEA
jgi:hypothetical protein